MSRSKFQILFVTAKKAATDYVCMSSLNACIDWLHLRWNKRRRHDVCLVSRAMHGLDSCNSPSLETDKDRPFSLGRNLFSLQPLSRRQCRAFVNPIKATKDYSTADRNGSGKGKSEKVPYNRDSPPLEGNRANEGLQDSHFDVSGRLKSRCNRIFVVRDQITTTSATNAHR